jgi:endonuclease/exonuclease/phosphatase family metal-dependent hydrolase
LIISINIPDNNGQLSTYIFGKSKSVEKTAFIAERIRAADIVALQEVVAGLGGAQAMVRLQDALNPYFFMAE